MSVQLCYCPECGTVYAKGVTTQCMRTNERGWFFCNGKWHTPDRGSDDWQPKPLIDIDPPGAAAEGVAS